jgi:hypothetical protein
MAGQRFLGRGLDIERPRGIDISGQRSKHMNDFTGERFDFVVTVCDNGREACRIKQFAASGGNSAASRGRQAAFLVRQAEIFENYTVNRARHAACRARHAVQFPFFTANRALQAAESWKNAACRARRTS